MHYNENGGRGTLITQDGNIMYKVVYPKHKAGGYTMKKVPVDPTFGL